MWLRKSRFLNVSIITGSKILVFHKAISFKSPKKKFHIEIFDLRTSSQAFGEIIPILIHTQEFIKYNKTLFDN